MILLENRKNIIIFSYQHNCGWATHPLFWSRYKWFSFSHLHYSFIQVELHVHFDGAGRRETLWEAIRSKGGELPGDGSFRAFEAAVAVRKPKDLLHFLKSFGHFCNAYMWVSIVSTGQTYSTRLKGQESAPWIHYRTIRIVTSSVHCHPCWFT